MKTKKTNQESTNSTQKNVEQKSYNWQNGASSSIGAAIGVAAGSMAQTAFATEPVTEGPVQPPHTDTPTVTSEVPLTNEPIAPQKPDTPATPIMPGINPQKMADMENTPVTERIAADFFSFICIWSLVS